LTSTRLIFLMQASNRCLQSRVLVKRAVVLDRTAGAGRRDRFVVEVVRDPVQGFQVLVGRRPGILLLVLLREPGLFFLLPPSQDVVVEMIPEHPRRLPGSGSAISTRLFLGDLDQEPVEVVRSSSFPGLRASGILRKQEDRSADLLGVFGCTLHIRALREL